MNTTKLPAITSENLTLQGELKTVPEDFLVEEIPAYLPSGEGEHLFLWIEKKDISADYLAGHVARTFGIKRDDIGVAGLKDRRAVTRQWISVPARTAEEKIDQLNTDLIQVLSASRHNNKLKTGHLKGNRFEIVIRGAGADDFSRAQSIVDELQKTGVPNYFGEQRFGHDGETLSIGTSLLKGESVPRRLPPQKRKFLTRLALSAVQSDLFNKTLSQRLTDGWLHEITLGDLMQVCVSGGIFSVEDVVAEQSRFDQKETVNTGPLFGPKMKEPQGRQHELETAVLEASGFVPVDFERHARFTSGARRPLLVWPEELRVEQVESGIRASFTLPSGSYATVVLAEFLKGPQA